MLILGLVPLGIAFAMAGGVAGSIWASLQDKDTLPRAFMEAVIASVFSAAVAERYLPLGEIFVCASVSILVGLMTGHALDTIKVIAPKAVEQFVEKYAGKFLGYKKDGANTEQK